MFKSKCRNFNNVIKWGVGRVLRVFNYKDSIVIWYNENIQLLLVGVDVLVYTV